MMAHWMDSGYKFDGLQKGLNHMTDWTLNQVCLYITVTKFAYIYS